MRAGWLIVLSLAIGALLSMGMPSATSQIGEPRPADDTAAQAPLNGEVEAIIAASSSLRTARFGVFARWKGQAVPLVDISGDQSFNTASNTKIVTAVAALALLGPEWGFTTGVWASGLSSDGTRAAKLTLAGGADPSLGIDHIVGLGRDLESLGLESVDSIAIDDSYFDNVDLPPHFDEQPREDAAFRAPVNAAGLGFNSFAVHVIPSGGGSGAARIIIDPPVDYLNVIESAVSTVSRGRTRIRVEASERRGRLDLRVRGQIRAGDARRVRQRISDPNAFAASVLRWSLKRAGISVASRNVLLEDVPANARLLASYRSSPLAVEVRGLGKYSNNYMAEMLLKTIGAEASRGEVPATWEASVSAVRDFLVSEVGLEDKSFYYGNGSGLFESNAFTPRQMVKILEHAAADPRIGAEAMSSLAVGGVDGTLRSRMGELRGQAVIRAKTGTLASVSALSGYLTLPGAPPIAFSIFVNNIPAGNVDSARSIQDAIVALLVGHAKRALEAR